jgi:hypothetical protein
MNNNPFLEGGESVHQYRGKYFVVDYYVENDTWQCSDDKFHMRTRGKTKVEVIIEMHKWWNLQIGGNNE